MAHVFVDADLFTSHWLAMAATSGSAILAFSHYVKL
jgi:hypothetical protein